MGERAIIERGMETLEEIGKGESTTFVLPQELTSLVGRYGKALSGSDVQEMEGLDGKEFDADTRKMLGLDDIDEILGQIEESAEMDVEELEKEAEAVKAGGAARTSSRPTRSSKRWTKRPSTRTWRPSARARPFTAVVNDFTTGVDRVTPSNTPERSVLSIQILLRFVTDGIDGRKRETLRRFAAIGAAAPFVGTASAGTGNDDTEQADTNETREAIRGYVPTTPALTSRSSATTSTSELGRHNTTSKTGGGQ